MAEVPKHIQRAYKRVAAQSALADVLAGRPPAPKGKATYRRSYAAAQEGTNRALQGLTLSARARARSVVMAEAFDITMHMKQVIGGGDALAALLASRKVTSPKKTTTAVPALVAVGSGEAVEPEAKVPVEPARSKRIKPPTRESKPAGPKHGEIGHTVKYDSGEIEVIGQGNTPSALWVHTGKERKGGYEFEENEPIKDIPTTKSKEWVLHYWGGEYEAVRLDAPPYKRTNPNTLKDPGCYTSLLHRITGFSEDSDMLPEPDACPEIVHPRMREFWFECVQGIRDFIEDGDIADAVLSGARHAGSLFAEKHNLTNVLKWNEDEQKFETTAEYRQTSERSAS